MRTLLLLVPLLGAVRSDGECNGLRKEYDQCTMQACGAHRQANCPDLNCLHFLALEECLASSVLWCDYFKVETGFIQQHFPAEHSSYPRGATSPLLPRSPMYSGPPPPTWLRSVAKLLDGGEEGRDWRALGNLLGYKQVRMEEFGDSLNPSVLLLSDWFGSSHNTPLSLEMVIACLDELKRGDVVEVIREEEEERESPQVFISYQWDHQEEAIRVRQFLEEAGLSCWMDIGQMGGGDALYTRIYQGISSCRVLLCCLSPKSLVSDYCTKEILLADLLKKPILPVMMAKTPWPPPGPLAMILAPLVYTDLAGAGGHGGQGKHADWLQKMAALLLKLEPLVVTERWEAHIKADTTILEECVEAVAVGVGNSGLEIPLDALGPMGNAPSLPSLPHSAPPSQSVGTGLEETNDQ